ncbi:mCG145285, partial [Mus musculus]
AVPSTWLSPGENGNLSTLTSCSQALSQFFACFLTEVCIGSLRSSSVLKGPFSRTIPCLFQASSPCSAVVGTNELPKGSHRSTWHGFIRVCCPGKLTVHMVNEGGFHIPHVVDIVVELNI